MATEVFAFIHSKEISCRGNIVEARILNYIDKLIDLVKDNKVVLDDIITHTLPLSEATKGYEIFDKKEDDCVKVVLKP